MRYVKIYVYLYVYIEFCAEAMVEMKKYIKPEIEIVEFDIWDKVTNGVMYELASTDVVPGPGGGDWESDSAEIFYGIEAGEEGYLVNNF